MFNFVCRSSFCFWSVLEIQKGVGFTPPLPSLKGGLLFGASQSQELTKFEAKCKSIVS